MKKPVGPKARPSLKNCKPEPGPGPIIKVQARARPARGEKLKSEPGPSPRKFRPDTSLSETSPLKYVSHFPPLITKFQIKDFFYKLGRICSRKSYCCVGLNKFCLFLCQIKRGCNMLFI